MKIVLDTNVIVSGLLSPYNAPGEIVRMVSSGVLKLCYDARIISEYRSVLLRQKFKFDPEHIDALIDQIKVCGYITVSKPLPKKLPDADDEPFLEVALAEKASYLITGNLIHYPVESCQKIKVVSPAKFVDVYRKSGL
ncbi:putative toxin-antitoxin system toxin component, PIN family [bacterium]|nr:putative toxin-antitoxin system toxin component, PIN family [bacterium]